MWYIFLLLFSALPLTSDEHAIYLSVVEVQPAENQTALIRVKVFSDDLKDVLKNYENENMRDAGTGETTRKQLAQAYFNQNLRLSVNSSPLQLKLKGITEENDATFLQFESVAGSEWTLIDLDAPYFTELFPTQINTFKITYAGKKYYARTGKGASRSSIILN